MISSQEKKIINNRVGLLNLAEELGNISKACKVMGFSRDTFYRYKEAHETGGVEALLDTNRKKPNRRNRVEDFIEKAILEVAIAEPAFGQVRVANELRKQGIAISAGGVRSVWMRRDLEVFPNRFKALERKRLEKEACGEVETEHPGYLGSQDTSYVGTLKGVGRIYQQTFVNTYSKVAGAKLYKMKTPLTAADLLNDKVLPLFEDHLIDYDVYSNWGNWMYLAGVGVDSRGSRRFNIESQLDRYDPKGEYIKKWNSCLLCKVILLWFRWRKK